MSFIGIDYIDSTIPSLPTAALKSAIDQATGSSSVGQLFASISNSDTATGESQGNLFVFVVGEDSAITDYSSSLNASISAMDEGEASVYPYVILKSLDQAVTQSSIGYKDIVDLIKKLDGELKYWYDIEGEYRLEKALDAVFDIYNELDGEYRLEIILDAIKDITSDIDGTAE